MIFITAFITGLLGSFHCAGMCGPIALATPTIGTTGLQKSWGKLLYNLGRIITYAVMGFLFGAFGLGLKLAGLQQSISIIAGVIIILTVLVQFNWLQKLAGNPFRFVKGEFIAKLFQTKTYGALLIIGLLNGLLPCGFVYIGLLGSVATQHAWQGALFMVLFGLGTLPMMFGVSMLGQILTQSTRSRIHRFTPILAVVIGCIFILRGLNLGVPYLSPKISENQTEVKECCKPALTQP